MPAYLPQPDSTLQEWSVTQYTEKGLGTDSQIITAKIAHNGVEALKVINHGDGAPNQYFATSKAAGTAHEELLKAINDCLKPLNINAFEVDDLWVDYAWRIQPTGMSFANYMTTSQRW